MSSIDHTPVNGVGVWQWTDTIYGSGAWIDLPTKHGVVYIATQGTGVVQYLHSAVVSDSKKTVAYIYNPADLAAGAQGQKAPWEVVPASYFDFPQVAGTEVDGIATMRPIRRSTCSRCMRTRRGSKFIPWSTRTACSTAEQARTGRRAAQ